MKRKQKHPGGRPPMPEGTQRVRVNVMLAPEVIAAIARIENRSAYIERLIRDDRKIPGPQ